MSSKHLHQLHEALAAMPAGNSMVISWRLVLSVGLAIGARGGQEHRALRRSHFQILRDGDVLYRRECAYKNFQGGSKCGPPVRLG